MFKIKSRGNIQEIAVYKNKLKFWHLVLAACCATLFISVDWESLAGEEFKDKLNYILYLDYGPSILSYVEFNSIVDYIKGEWMWHFMLDSLVRSEVMTRDTFFTIVSFSLVLVYSLIILRDASPWYLLLLINPLIVDFGFTQFRHALSMVFIALAFFEKRLLLRIGFLTFAVLIHTSALLFIFLYFVSNYLLIKFYHAGKLEALRYRILLTALAISIALGPALSVLLAYIGDRRVGDKDISSSFLYLSFWIFASVLFMINLKWIKLSIPAIFSLILLLAAAMTVFTNGYSLRILSVLFPFFIVLMANSTPKLRLSMVFTLVGYSMVQWLYWLKII